MQDLRIEGLQDLTILEKGIDHGYHLARMRFEIVLAPEPTGQLRRLPTPVRSGVTDAIELHLRYEPTKVSRSRIKRLRGLS